MIFYIILGCLFLTLFVAFYVWNKSKKKPIVTKEKRNVKLTHFAQLVESQEVLDEEPDVLHFTFRNEEWTLKYTERSVFLIKDNKQIRLEHILPKKYDITHPIPFEWNGELMLLESYFPLIIYVCDSQTGECKNFLEKHRVQTPNIGQVEVVSPPSIVWNSQTQQEDYLFLAKLTNTHVEYFFFWLNSITMEPSIPSTIIDDWMDYHIKNFKVEDDIKVVTNEGIFTYPKDVLQDIA